MKPLEHYWYQSGIQANIIAWLLLPFSWLYCAVAVIRRKIYQLKIKKSYSASVPVVIVGNIVVGGSGKTPLLISLCEFFKENGYKAGVVSRGYGGKVTGVRQVLDSDDAAIVGDEPLMIHQSAKVPVVVGADRVAAVNYLLENNKCDVVLSDDGLQHYRMQRDFEIAVIDSQRRFGNGFCLPAGPLRERISRLNDVDLTIYNGSEGASDKAVERCWYTLKIVELYHLNSDERVSLSSFADKTVHAVAGIGYPPRFFTQLRDNGIDIIEHAYPDHYSYTQSDFSGWSDDCIIMTEKDAVKCRHLLLPDAWVVRVSADISTSVETQLKLKILPLLSGQSG